ncbi:PREDICTED: arylsulfatase B-like [Ceratosolen solmsi marchali]|uniref:Arylsulfatase B-like n=1 Tax=Ceratosolen solmsi marchali TaxID=326594 RepID=A0AAJ7DY16_9HYME|nr:PREDICTED: arylsulfatase B-like [Ceratosolen solmsi marchali]
MKTQKFISVVLWLALVSLCLKSTAANVKKPHIIFIVADDLGWNDVSFHGANEIPTPNIDALAYNGVILNRHYVLPISSPSRSALLTGRYPIRDGTQGFDLEPGEARGIPLNRTLMPEYLRQLGYGTHLVGKWHAGYHSVNHTPARRGFDSFYGFYNKLIGYFDHTIKLLSEDGQVHIGNDLHRDTPEALKVVHDKGYITDLITNEAIMIINNNGNEKPLFLEISHLASHGNQNVLDPLEVPDMQETNATFSYISDLKRRKYAGVVKSLDDSVGRVVTALSKAKMLENSIIVFISDNGAPTTGMYGTSGSNYPLRGMKNSLFEGGVRGVACIFSPLIKSAGRVSMKKMHIVDWLPTLYAAAGGNANNLNDIDGLNQWPSIVDEDVKSLRNHILLDINLALDIEGIILENYKLIRVQPHTSNKLLSNEYYGSNGNSSFNPHYNILESALSSPTGLAISHLTEFNSTSVTKADNVRKRSEVRCSQPKTFADCSNYCLFNLENDPCETNDLAKHSIRIRNVLIGFLYNYRKLTVQPASDVIDSRSFPENFHGTWMPWKNV